MLDLDFDQEQELLRQTVRDVWRRHCPLDVVRADGGRPRRLSRRRCGRSWASSTSSGCCCPRSTAARACRWSRAWPSTRSWAAPLAPTPHFVSAVLSGGVLAAAGSDAQKEQWLRPVASGEAILTPAWLEPENGFSPRGVETRAEADGVGFPAQRDQAPRRLRLGRRPAGRAGPHRRRRRGRRPLPGGPDGARGDAAPAVQHRLGHPVRGRPSTVSPSASDDRIGPAGSGWATWQEVLEPALVLLARPGRRRRPLRARDHDAVRQGPPASSTSRSAPSRRWPTTWPTPSPTWTGPSSWCTRRPGPERRAGR